MRAASDSALRLALFADDNNRKTVASQLKNDVKRGVLAVIHSLFIVVGIWIWLHNLKLNGVCSQA